MLHRWTASHTEWNEDVGCVAMLVSHGGPVLEDGYKALAVLLRG